VGTLPKDLVGLAELDEYAPFRAAASDEPATATASVSSTTARFQDHHAIVPTGKAGQAGFLGAQRAPGFRFGGAAISRGFLSRRGVRADRGGGARGIGGARTRLPENEPRKSEPDKLGAAPAEEVPLVTAAPRRPTTFWHEAGCVGRRVARGWPASAGGRPTTKTGGKPGEKKGKKKDGDEDEAGRF